MVADLQDVSRSNASGRDERSLCFLFEITGEQKGVSSVGEPERDRSGRRASDRFTDGIANCWGPDFRSAPSGEFRRRPR